MGLFFLPKKGGRSQGFRKRSWYLWGGRRQNQLQSLCPRWFLQQPSQTCGTGFVWKLMVLKLRVDFFNILLSSSKPFKADIAIASLAHVASSSIWNIPEKDEKWIFEWSITLEWSKITATVHFGNLWDFLLYWPDVEIFDVEIFFWCTDFLFTNNNNTELYYMYYIYIYWKNNSIIFLFY